jgi:hypothetical protein
VSRPLSEGLQEIWFEMHETTWLKVTVKLNTLHLHKNQTANINGTMAIKTVNVKSTVITENK